MEGPALGYPKVAPTKHVGRPALKNAGRDAREILFSQFVEERKPRSAPTYWGVTSQDAWTESQIAKFRRIFLLDTALEAEGLRIARSFFLQWMYGPSAREPTFDFDGKKALPYRRVPYSLFGNTRVVGLAESAARDASERELSELRSGSRADLARVIMRRAKAEFEARPLEVGATRDLRNDMDSLTRPPFYLGEAAKIDVKMPMALRAEVSPDSVPQLGAESLGSPGVGDYLDALKLVRAGQKFPPVVAALGSFSLFAYANGHLSRPAEDKLQYVIDTLGFRIVDGFNFEGSQPLGWWYPYEGHKAPEESLDAPSATAALGDLLWNGDFAAFASAFRPEFNSYLRATNSGRRELVCEDFWVVSRMKKEAISPEKAVTVDVPVGESSS